MHPDNTKHLQDIQRILAIPIVPTLMEVCCQVTGAGFCAIARVTEDQWICCDVRDDIQFGMKPGDELAIEKTFCNTVRLQGREVIFNNIQLEGQYYQHPIALMYGIESYISVPIFQRDGSFFGTLCALDKQQLPMDDPKVVAMFRLFAELIAFHLESSQLLQQSLSEMVDLNHELASNRQELRQYQYISHHNLLEPLRKMRVFSSLLSGASDRHDIAALRNYADKLNQNASRFSLMLKDLTDYSSLDLNSTVFEKVALQQVVSQLTAGTNRVSFTELPEVRAIALQMEQLFDQLITYFLLQSEHPIAITAKAPDSDTLTFLLPGASADRYWLITISDAQTITERYDLDKLFDLFSAASKTNKNGVGLAYAKKIIHNHRGAITAMSSPETGTVIQFLLPR